MNGEVARTEARAAELDLYLDAVPGAVPAARHSAARWAATEGANGPDLYRICLAVSEAVTNALVHAYSHRDTDADGPAPDPAPDDATRQIHLRGAAGSGELTIFVADKGCGIGRALASPGSRARPHGDRRKLRGARDQERRRRRDRAGDALSAAAVERLAEPRGRTSRRCRPAR